jgi:hypothetical protein
VAPWDTFAVLHAASARSSFDVHIGSFKPAGPVLLATVQRCRTGGIVRKQNNEEVLLNKTELVRAPCFASGVQ